MMAIGGFFSNILGGAGTSSSSLSGAGQAISMYTSPLSIAPAPNMSVSGVHLANTSEELETLRKLECLKNYVEICGDTLEYIHLDKMIETKDPKVSMLKLATDGEFIKNVGLKISPTVYYVIREKE
jgi:hypothetical protein